MTCGNLRDLPGIADQVQQCRVATESATEYSQQGNANAIRGSIKMSSQATTPTAYIFFSRLSWHPQQSPPAASSFDCTIKSKSARLLGMQGFFYSPKKAVEDAWEGGKTWSEEERGTREKGIEERESGTQPSPTKPALLCAATQYPGTSDMCSHTLAQFSICEANQKWCYWKWVC